MYNVGYIGGVPCRPNLLSAIIAAQKAQSIQRSVTLARTNLCTSIPVMGGLGDMSPYFLIGGDALCFVPHTFSKFSQLILRKIIKIVATRCQILRLKCTKFDFGWGSAPDPAGGAYSAPPDPL